MYIIKHILPRFLFCSIFILITSSISYGQQPMTNYGGNDSRRIIKVGDNLQDEVIRITNICQQGECISLCEMTKDNCERICDNSLVDCNGCQVDYNNCKQNCTCDNSLITSTSLVWSYGFGSTDNIEPGIPTGCVNNEVQRGEIRKSEFKLSDFRQAVCDDLLELNQIPGTHYFKIKNVAESANENDEIIIRIDVFSEPTINVKINDEINGAELSPFLSFFFTPEPKICSILLRDICTQNTGVFIANLPPVSEIIQYLE